MTRKLWAAIVVLLCFGVWMAVAPYLAKRLIVERELPQADAIVVLSGSSVYLERVDQAAAAYRRGIAQRIILSDDGIKSGWSPEEKTNLPYVELARRRLIDSGIPAGAIEIMPGAISGTIDEARACRAKATENHWTSLLVVTSAYHSRRALWAFERVFAESDPAVVIGIEPAAPGRLTPMPSFWWTSPRGWKFVAGEYVKSAYYFVSY